MERRIPGALMVAALLISCGAEPAEAPQGNAAVDGAAADSADDERLRDVFVEEVPSGARLLFVGPDSTVRPADRADALFIPFSTFSVERDGIPNEFPPADSMADLLRASGVDGAPVVIVGEPIPAARAWAAFDYLGRGDDAALLDGGAGALAAAPSADTEEAGEQTGGVTGGEETVTDGSRTDDDPGELETSVRDGMIVDAEWIREHLGDENVAILDARPPAEYTGERPGEGIERPGHIPGASNLFWQTLVESAEQPRLKDEAELRRLFEEAGADPGDTVVTYCRTGGQASFLYAVARHLGYNVRLYDGSFIDWSRTDHPVEG